MLELGTGGKNVALSGTTLYSDVAAISKSLQYGLLCLMSVVNVRPIVWIRKPGQAVHLL